MPLQARLAEVTDPRCLIAMFVMAELMSHPCAAGDSINSFRGISHLSSRMLRAKLASLPIKTFVSPWRCLITPRLAVDR